MGPASVPLPPDDLTRAVSSRRVGDGKATVVHVVGDTYTILISGRDTAGHFTLIDMVVPSGGGPPLHRHDFEETFSVLAGEIEVTCRDETVIVGVGDSANIPSNAPHKFVNRGNGDVHLLCTCSPAGQEDFFIRVDAGEDPREIAAEFRTELLGGE